MIEGASVLKADVRGRVRVPNDRREELLNEFERSGISGPKFAALIGVKYQTFAWWVQQRRQRREREKNALVGQQTGTSASAKVETEVVPLPALKWIKASVEPAPPGKARGPASATTLPVLLPGGARLEIADVSQVELAAQLLNALSRRSC